MKVRDGLLAELTVVDDQTVAVLETLRASEFGRDPKEMSDERLVLSIHSVDAGQWSTGHNEDVSGSLRCNVMKGAAKLVFVQHHRWDVAVEDFLEECGFGHDALRLVDA